jgi:agmatine/peptidylarginine deiminase
MLHAVLLVQVLWLCSSQADSFHVVDGMLFCCCPAAEWAQHQGCWVAWPRRHDVWRAAAGPAKKAFTDVILAINRFEPVTVVAPSDLVSACWLRSNITPAAICCIASFLPLPPAAV